MLGLSEQQECVEFISRIYPISGGQEIECDFQNILTSYLTIEIFTVFLALFSSSIFTTNMIVFGLLPKTVISKAVEDCNFLLPSNLIRTKVNSQVCFKTTPLHSKYCKNYSVHNNLSIHCSNPENRRQIQSKISRRQKIIKNQNRNQWN